MLNEETPTIPVRTARLSDAEEVARLTVQLGYDASGPTTERRLTRILTRADQRFLVAPLEERLTGWLHAFAWELVETGPFVVIGGLVVDRSFRRKGIGRALLSAAETWAIERGCSVVRLWSSVGRTEAHRFYEHLGYANIKSQYSFVKSVGCVGSADISAFVPRLDR
jgi:GNAT superfamily N-acetyltransferase